MHNQSMINSLEERNKNNLLIENNSFTHYQEKIILNQLKN